MAPKTAPEVMQIAGQDPLPADRDSQPPTPAPRLAGPDSDLHVLPEGVQQEQPGIGDTPLFPSPAKHSVPVDTFLPAKWLRKAEELAGLEPMDGPLWHACRRRWATVRKHLPAVDVAAAGGWAGPHTLQTIYQRPDEDTMYEVVTGGGEVRETRQS